jgi:hypothetical protein
MMDSAGMCEVVHGKVPCTLVIDPSKLSFQDGTSATDKFVCQPHEVTLEIDASVFVLEEM